MLVSIASWLKVILFLNNVVMMQKVRACLKHALILLCIEEKDYRGEVAADCQVNHKVPDQVVVLKSLFCVEPCADGVENSACSNQHK